MLTANGNELFYYTFMNEKTRHNYEIDFILTRNNKICPIEVKSSGYKTHASLDKFSEKYSGRIAEKYLVAIFTALFFRSRPSAMQQLESTAAQLLLAVWRAPYSRITASCHLQVNLRDVCRNFYCIGFSNRPSAMQQLESTAAQLLLAVWRAPYSRITASCHLQVNLRDVCRNFYCIGFSNRPSAMQQLESTAAQLLLAVWRPPYSGITIKRYLQASLQSACR